MITVAGFNTAIDRMLRVGRLEPGTVARTDEARVLPGGKGVHVAQVLALLGEDVQLVGLTDERHAAFLHERLAARGVRFIGVPAGVPLRTCIAIVEADGRTSELLERGAALAPGVGDALVRTLIDALPGSKALVVSGSLPHGMATDTYARIAGLAGMPCFIDASGEALAQASRAHPTLIKPNRDEASALVGQAINDAQDAAAAMTGLVAQGIAYPVITLGAAGAVGADATGCWHAHLPVARIRHAVGSGDCFLAGITAALLRGDGMSQALRLGVACGAANALNDETGWMDMAVVGDLLPRVTVQAILDP